MIKKKFVLFYLKQEKLTDLPIITNISLLEAGITQNGEKVTDALSTLVNLGADIVGLNCHLGPYHMIKV